MCESLQEVPTYSTEDQPKLLAFVVPACACCEPVKARQAVARPIQSNAPSVVDYDALATERYVAWQTERAVSADITALRPGNTQFESALGHRLQNQLHSPCFFSVTPGEWRHNLVSLSWYWPRLLPIQSVLLHSILHFISCLGASYWIKSLECRFMETAIHYCVRWNTVFRSFRKI